MTFTTNRRNKRRVILVRNTYSTHSHASTVLGIGATSDSMTLSTTTRINKGRNHEVFTREENRATLIRKLILQRCRCAVTNLPMVVYGNNMQNPWDDFRASPDRIDNSKGYEFDNVQMVCNWVNLSTACAHDANFVHSILREGAKTVILPTEPPPFSFHLLYLQRELWIPINEFDYKLFGLRQKPQKAVYERMQAIALSAFDELEQ
jgi:hypothetical protein